MFAKIMCIHDIMHGSNTAGTQHLKWSMMFFLPHVCEYIQVDFIFA